MFLSKTLTRGDIESLAAILDVSPSLISQQFNPDEDKKSYLYQAIRMLWAAYQVSPELGDSWLKLFNCYARKWSHAPIEKANLPDLAGRAVSEVADVVVAQLNNLPFERQLIEAQQARTAIESYINGLMMNDIDDCAQH